jgi:hypothetical protein
MPYDELVGWEDLTLGQVIGFVTDGQVANFRAGQMVDWSQ